MYIPGSVLANNTGHGEEVGLFWTLGLGKVCWRGPVVIKVFQKVMCTDNFGPGTGGGRGGGGDGARVQPQWFGS